VWGSLTPSIRKSKRFKAGDSAILSTIHGDVEVVVLHLLPRGRVAVVNWKGLNGIHALVKKKACAWFDITLLDLVEERVPLDIRYVKAKNLRKPFENKE